MLFGQKAFNNKIQAYQNRIDLEFFLNQTDDDCLCCALYVYNDKLYDQV